jgi:release factor glutamine methyltransferase
VSSRPAPARPAAPPQPLRDGRAAAPGRSAAGGEGVGAAATWGELLGRATQELGDRREARWLLEEASALRWSSLRSRLGEPAHDQAAAAYAVLTSRRKAGEPLQHVLGHWSFRSLDLLVDGRALIPRPETEVLVEHALAVLAALDTPAAPPRTGTGTASPTGGGDAVAASAAPGTRTAPPRRLAADLGTGSGAIACALVSERRDVHVLAVERSPAALALAAANVARLDADAARRVRLLCADWYAAVADRPHGGLHLVVANPPYLAAGELAGLDPSVRCYEPHEALVAGTGGLEAIGAVLAGAPRVLAPGGCAVVEIAPGQADAACSLARAAGAVSARVELDLAGRERVLVACF